MDVLFKFTNTQTPAPSFLNLSDFLLPHHVPPPSVAPLRHAFLLLLFLLHLSIHTSVLPSFLPKGSHSRYHTERAGMAGHAPAD